MTRGRAIARELSRLQVRELSSPRAIRRAIAAGSYRGSYPAGLGRAIALGLAVGGALGAAADLYPNRKAGIR
jgi:uncharacterized protein (DUF2062 family)